MATNAVEARSSRNLTLAIFTIYALLLTGLVLAKFPFRYDLSPTGRELNLIPFTGLFSNFGAFHLSEVIQNVVIFVPFGIYLSMLAREWSFGKRLVPIIATTLCCETVQFITATGRADITDIIDNITGGIIGLLLYAVAHKLLGTKTHDVLNVAGAVVTSSALVTVAIVFAHTLRTP